MIETSHSINIKYYISLFSSHEIRPMYQTSRPSDAGCTSQITLVPL